MTEIKKEAPDAAFERERKFKFALSLSRKAGKALCGMSIVCDGIRSKSTAIVILSESASENSKKRITNCASYYNVKLLETTLSPETLGASVGKTALACIGITDKNLAFIVERNLY